MVQMSKALKDVGCFTIKHIIHWIVPEKISHSMNETENTHSPDFWHPRDIDLPLSWDISLHPAQHL